MAATGDEYRAVDRAKSAGAHTGYVYLHSIVDGFSRLAYTEPLPDEKGATAAAFLARAKVWFAAHGVTHINRVVTDNGPSSSHRLRRRGAAGAPDRATQQRERKCWSG